MDVALQQAVNALSLGGTYALLALGLAMVFSVLGLINFAHGELMTLSGYGLVLAAALGLPFLPAVVLAVAVAMVSAVAMERIAFRPVRNASMATMLLTSFAVSVIIQVLFQNLISARPQPVPVPSALTGAVSIAGLDIGTIQLVSIAATVLLLAGLTLFLRRSLLGMAMRAAAVDFPVTRLMGVNANRVVAAAFAVSGLLAGVAGVLWVAQRGSVDPLMGFAPVLKAFIAVVLGGIGSLSGAVVGGFALGIIEVSLRALLPDDALPFRDAIALSLVIAVLLARPDGLVGRRPAMR